MLVPSALWLYQKWTQSASLQELRLMEMGDPRESLLYTLSYDGTAQTERIYDYLLHAYIYMYTCVV